MSAISTITVYDGASTPVAHALVPVAVSREKDGTVLAEYREAATNVPAYAQVRLSLRLTRLKTGVTRTESRLVVPVMEAILNQNAAGYTAAPKVAYENTVVTNGFFHERSDIDGRRLVRQMSVNLSGGISTSVTPVTTGPFAELFDLLISPT